MSNKPGLKKQREKILSLMDCDVNDSWACVELCRWQHRNLPNEKDEKRLNVSEGLKGMAEAIMSSNPKNFPTPLNVASVLFYAAKIIEKNVPAQFQAGDFPQNQSENHPR